MSRVKGGPVTRRKHKKVLKRTKGFKYGRKNLYSLASRADMKAGLHAYVGRKLKKRDFRRLWITRLSAGARARGIRYGEFIDMLTKKLVRLDRKVLSEIAVSEPATFSAIVEFAKLPPQTKHKPNGLKTIAKQKEKKTLVAETKKETTTK